jgi:hypothetical protein
MPGERKRKNTEKNPQRKKAERKQSRRIDEWAHRYLKNLSASGSRKRHAGAFLGKIVAVHGGNKYDVQGQDGIVHIGLPLAGKMRLGGKLHHNPEVMAAREGGFVFVDGGQVAAVLDGSDAKSARKKVGWNNAAGNDFFNRGSRSRSRSRSGSL